MTDLERQIYAFRKVVAACDERKAKAVAALVALTKEPHYIAGRKVHFLDTAGCNASRTRNKKYRYLSTKDWDEVTCMRCLKRRKT